MKPFTEARVTVELAEVPAMAETLVGLAVAVKSVTWKRIDAVTCDSELIVLVTVTV